MTPWTVKTSDGALLLKNPSSGEVTTPGTLLLLPISDLNAAQGERDCGAGCPTALALKEVFHLDTKNAVKVRSTNNGDIAFTDREAKVRHHFYMDEKLHDKIALFDAGEAFLSGTAVIMYAASLPWCEDKKARTRARKDQVNANRNKRAADGRPDKKYGSRVCKWKARFDQ